MQKSSSHERIEGLLSFFGNPHKGLRFIHIAGTNGKGSICGALSSIFIKAGYKTGLFTSPYVIEFGERIQINGRYIDRDSLIEITGEIREVAERLEEWERPTVFEFITLIAMIYFKRQSCDIVVLEAGIGGLHDSTNVIPAPLACVFSSISLDHTEMLGATVEKIAEEKSGIIKRGALVISYPEDEKRRIFTGQKKEAAEILRLKAEKEGCSFFSPRVDLVEALSVRAGASQLTYKSLKIKTHLMGRHQILNMLTVAETALAVRERGFNLSDGAIMEAIEEFSLFCRMEIISREPTVILDGGHNEGCMRALREMAEQYFPGKKLTLVMASMKDKDYRQGLRILAPLCSGAVFTCTDEIRGEGADKLKQWAESIGMKETYTAENPLRALERAMEIRTDDGVILCCGSFYLVSDIRKIFSGD